MMCAVDDEGMFADTDLIIYTHRSGPAAPEGGLIDNVDNSKDTAPTPVVYIFRSKECMVVVLGEHTGISCVV